MDCYIIFDKNDNAYTVGETITGRVEIRNAHPKDIRHIALIVRGKAEVRWTESQSYTQNGKRKTRTVTYTAEEQYLNSHRILFGQEGGPTIQLPVGTHTYTFQCLLPVNLPGTMDGYHGKIWYDVKVKFDIPWAIDDTFKRQFTVIPIVDMSHDFSLKLPSEIEKIKEYCSWKCSTSPAVMKVKIPKTGFIIKEIIPITININNLSTVNITEIQTKLVKRIVFTSRSPRNKDRTDETKVTYQKYDLTLNPRMQTIDLTSKLIVPQTPLTEVKSSIITTTYYVEVAIYVSGCHTTARFYIPVTIGTNPIDSIEQLAENTSSEIASPITNMMPPVPLPQNPSPVTSPVSFHSSRPTMAEMPMPPPVPTAPLALDTPTDPSAPPPSYNEVMFGKQEN